MPQTTTLIAAARNEGPFLLEWVAYHRAIGVDHIVILSDPSEDGTEVLLDRLAATGAITHIAHHQQGGAGIMAFPDRAYAHARDLPHVRNADWVLALDIDEYLAVHVGAGRLDDLYAALARCGETDVLALGWRIFGNAGQAGYINRLLLPRLTRAAPESPVRDPRHLGIKSLFRPQHVTAIGPHRPIHASDAPAAVWRNGAGQNVSRVLGGSGTALTPATRGHTLAQINHYPVRGNAVFALHHLRHPPLTGEARVLTLADHAAFNCNHVIDTGITRWAQATTAEIKRLQGFAGVQAAHKAAVAAFEGLIASFRAELGDPETDPVAALFEPDIARRTMARQTADDTAPPPAPETAAAMQMVAPADMAPAWLTDLRQSRHNRGWYVADDQFAVQMTTRATDVLLLTFDGSADVRNQGLARSPWAYALARAEGWSHMGVMPFAANWYRDARLFNFLAGQVRTGVFARFDRVVLTGAEMGGYAAAAFAGLVPGCTVLAFAPQASLAPDLAPEETRFASGRAADWSGPYRDAAAESAAAEAVFVVSDPYVAADRAHAERFTGDHVTHLPAWYAPPLTAQTLLKADFAQATLRAAVAGDLTPARFARIYRSRRGQSWYIRGLSDHVLARGKHGLASALAASLQTRAATG